MKRFLIFFSLMMVCFATAAMAFSWNPVNWVKSGLEAGGWTVVAYLVTAFLALAVFGTVVAVRIIQTMKEAGELLIALSDALADRKVTPDEIKLIIADVRDVFNVWKATPPAYIPDK